MYKKSGDTEKAKDGKIDTTLNKQKIFKANKVRATVKCINCQARRVIVSMYEPGSEKGGPRMREVATLQRFIEKQCISV